MTPTEKPVRPGPNGRAAWTWRLAILTSVSTLVLLAVGGTVNPTGSSLACPDWPTCHGSFFPEMTGGVEFEHTHRAVATLVGLLTCILGGLLWFSDRDRTTRRLGLAAIVMVVAQGVLGGVTVLLELPPVVSMTHLGLSMLFFALTLVLCFRARPGWTPARAGRGITARLVWAGAAAVWVQILLGGMVRHAGAAHACGLSIPWCEGLAWPPALEAQIHMIHRYGAVVASVFVVAASAAGAWQATRADRRLAYIASWLAPWILAAQITLGVLSVTSGIGVVEVTAHLLVGALLFASLVIAALSLGTMGVVGIAVEAVETDGEEAAIPLQRRA